MPLSANSLPLSHSLSLPCFIAAVVGVSPGGFIASTMGVGRKKGSGIGNGEGFVNLRGLTQVHLMGNTHIQTQ